MDEVELGILYPIKIQPPSIYVANNNLHAKLGKPPRKRKGKEKIMGRGGHRALRPRHHFHKDGAHIPSTSDRGNSSMNPRPRRNTLEAKGHPHHETADSFPWLFLQPSPPAMTARSSEPLPAILPVIQRCPVHFGLAKRTQYKGTSSKHEGDPVSTSTSRRSVHRTTRQPLTSPQTHALSSCSHS